MPFSAIWALNLKIILIVKMLLHVAHSTKNVSNDLKKIHHLGLEFRISSLIVRTLSGQNYMFTYHIEGQFRFMFILYL